MATEHLTRKPERSPIGKIVHGLIRFSRRKPLGGISLVMVAIIIFTAIFANFLTPQDPNDNVFHHITDAPNSRNWLGTDDNGRDVFSRIIIGTQISVIVGVSAVILGSMLGFVWGVTSGYLGGKFDLLSQRLIELILAFPSIILALMMLVPFGASLGTVIIVIAITRVPWGVRVIRSVAIATSSTDYVQAAKAIGATQFRIVGVHVAPACVPAILIVASAHIGTAIIIEASLSFLGFGVPPPTASWGSMLAGSVAQVVKPLWWLAVFPGVAISVTVLAYSLLGDAIRDELDPKLRGAG